MTERAKFEQMLESLINGDQKQAEELFHELVVAKSRDIYENLLDDDIQVDEEVEDDEEVDESFEIDEIGGDPADDMISDLEADDGEEEFGGDEMGSDEPATKDDVMDIKDALEDLKAEFEAMLAGDAGAEDEEADGEEGDDDMDADFGGDDMDDEEKKEEYVREYVEKVAPAKMGDNGANTRSTVAGKNDMGGTTANIARGGESTKGGTQGGLANPTSKEDNAGNVNVPGARKAATLSNVKAPKGGDNGANTKSTLGA